MGISKFPQLGLLRFWGRIIPMQTSDCNDVQSKVVAFVNNFPTVCRRLPTRNGIGSNFWLLMVGSQTASLTSGLSFDHKLCYKYSNGQCEPILDIFTSIDFQWYKELFKAMTFYPCNRVLKIRDSIRDFNSQHGSSFGSVRVHAFTLFALPGVCDVAPRSLSSPAPLQPKPWSRAQG